MIYLKINNIDIIAYNSVSTDISAEKKQMYIKFRLSFVGDRYLNDSHSMRKCYSQLLKYMENNNEKEY